MAKKGRRYKWLDRTKIRYRNFSKVKGKQKCMTIDNKSDKSGWKPTNCGKKHLYICKRKSKMMVSDNCSNLKKKNNVSVKSSSVTVLTLKASGKTSPVVLIVIIALFVLVIFCIGCTICCKKKQVVNLQLK